MKINFDDVQSITRLEIERHSAQFPYFLPLKPRECTTGDVEALSSFLCRQAEIVSEWSHPYTWNIFKKHLAPSKMSKCTKSSCDVFRGCNGIGPLADKFIDGIDTASGGRIDTARLTLKPLQNLSTIQGRGLQRPQMSWCDECWKQDILQDETPYVRLYWLLQNTKICVHHNIRLSEHCPSCGEVKHQFPKHPRQ